MPRVQLAPHPPPPLQKLPRHSGRAKARPPPRAARGRAGCLPALALTVATPPAPPGRRSTLTSSDSRRPLPLPTSLHLRRQHCSHPAGAPTDTACSAPSMRARGGQTNRPRRHAHGLCRPPAWMPPRRLLLAAGLRPSFEFVGTVAAATNGESNLLSSPLMNFDSIDLKLGFRCKYYISSVPAKIVMHELSYTL